MSKVRFISNKSVSDEKIALKNVLDDSEDDFYARLFLFYAQLLRKDDQVFLFLL